MPVYFFIFWKLILTWNNTISCYLLYVYVLLPVQTVQTRFFMHFYGSLVKQLRFCGITKRKVHIV